MQPKWLLPQDGSDASLRAVTHVIHDVGTRTAAPHVFLLHVHAPLSSDITRFINGKTVEDFHREAGDAALAKAKQMLSEAGVTYSAHILVGEAAPAIVEFAKSKDCSLIVIGAHGFGAVKGLLMGSVATKVIHLSPLPVLVAK